MSLLPWKHQGASVIKETMTTADLDKPGGSPRSIDQRTKPKKLPVPKP